MSAGPPLRGALRQTQSKLWARAENDWYVEPSWCDERLFAVETFEGSIYDPACGMGRIVLAARAAGLDAHGSDIVSRSDVCEREADFLDWRWPMGARVENIISNPPFALCDDRRARTHPFVDLALKRANRKVALLLPSNWVQGASRSRWLATTPLRRVLFLTPRPSMPPGQVIAAGGKPGNGTTDYAWFIWLKGFDGRPELGWLHRDADQSDEKPAHNPRKGDT